MNDGFDPNTTENNMGYMTNGLTFNTLRSANLARRTTFKISNEWTPAQWLQAVVGELGEYANIMKKVDRGDFTLEQAKQSLADELADVQTYLDLMANNIGIDLGAATMDKWNRVSERHGCNIMIAADDWHYKKAPEMPSVGKAD